MLIFLTTALLPVAGSASDDARSVLSQGNYADAIATYTARLADSTGMGKIKLQISRGEAYRALGYYRQARTDFNQALETALDLEAPVLTAIATQTLGYIDFLERHMEMAEMNLRSALLQAEALDKPVLAAACANRLGTVLFNLNQPEDALKLYQKALNYLNAADDPGLEAAIRRNLSRVVVDNEAAVALLISAQKKADAVSLPYERAELLMAIASEARQREFGEQGISLSYTSLIKAFEIANDLEAARLQSLSAGKLGALYENRDRLAEAMDLTQHAIGTAQSINAHDLLLQWEWQIGRLMNARGEKIKAIDAYRRAVFHIESIRQDIPIEYQDGRSSFRETLAPIYFGLADLLLQQSDSESDLNVQQAMLNEARYTVEKIKQSELQDYFKDPCIAAYSHQIETLSPATAVIYPIILPDRLELLIDIGGRLFRKTSKIKQADLEEGVLRLAGQLRIAGSVKNSARDVYTWMIAPIVPLLDENQIDTLVYVPDGALRLLPIAALWDGKKFLIERYAIANVPGLTLLDPKPTPRGEMTCLLAGMSKPGPVVQDLPENLWLALQNTPMARMDQSVRGLNIEAKHLQKSVTPRIEDRNKSDDLDKIQKMLALPGVEKEIASLSHNLKGNVLLNEGFKLKPFTKALETEPYRIVHIASHGYFGGSPEQNFIMTYNKLLNMNQLEALIKPKQFAQKSVEVIALSACQTAEGDDRSPLGLTGIALKSGARSALGSLWPVSDLAAQSLLPAFYAHLKDSRVTKAKALRQAQLDLMKQEGFQHPYYWSAFILVGNWL